ncbi:hypothetical protein HDU91_002710, partial [Kappamyces sp. JEL0680]
SNSLKSKIMEQQAVFEPWAAMAMESYTTLFNTAMQGKSVSHLAPQLEPPAISYIAPSPTTPTIAAVSPVESPPAIPQRLEKRIPLP